MPSARPISLRSWFPQLRTAVCVGAALLSGLALADGPPYAGRRLDDVLRELGEQGLRLVYSTETVPEALTVRREPTGTSPRAILDEILAEHGLVARRVGADSFAIVRAGAVAAAPGTEGRVAAGVPLEEVVIAASRYSLAAETPDVHTFFTQEQIAALPRLADDSLKAVHRLPGAASNGLSGLANLRGGEGSETLIVFDGLPLYEPFHLRLLLSPTSVLDPRVVGGLDVHAGGFTAQYGDRMSAVIDATSVRPPADAYYELGASLFHLSALASHRFAAGRGQWLAAARRSNLDEVADLVDSGIGEPSYGDAFGRIDYAFDDRTRASLNVLVASDRAEVQNTAETEFAEAEYRNSYVWAALEHTFSPALDARVIASYTDIAAQRDGEVDEPGRRTGSVDDQRHYDVLGLKLDGTWRRGRWVHRAGLEYRALSADYDYTGEVRFEPGYPWPGSPAQVVARAADPQPSGDHVAAYLTSRLLVTPDLAAELGLRWDKQSYSPDSDRQFGPRVNLAWQADEATRLRASWGRYQQFQGINELQVEDGVTEFQPAQRADHWIVGLERDLDAGLTLRVEAYRKDYDRLQPRYESLFDPLSLAPELRWDRVRIAPSGARAAGFETLLTRRSAEPWNGWLSYTWSRVTDRENGNETRRSWDQTHALGAGLTWASGPWNATLAASYHTGWPTTTVGIVDPGTPQASVVVGRRNSIRYEDYSSLDLRLSRTFALRRGDLDVFVEVTNVLDRRNPCCTDYSYEYPGGQLALEREVRHWLPLVPSAGVLWKF